MFDSRDRISTYLQVWFSGVIVSQFVFPKDVTVELQASEPTFFSFMMTDVNHNNSFFHALIFHEEVNEAEIDSADFDIVADQNGSQRGDADQ